MTEIGSPSSESETSCLDLSYSSSEFDGDNSHELDGGLEPYLYEPMQDTTDTQESYSDDEENLERLSNLNWYIFFVIQ